MIKKLESVVEEKEVWEDEKIRKEYIGLDLGVENDFGFVKDIEIE